MKTSSKKLSLLVVWLTAMIYLPSLSNAQQLIHVKLNSATFFQFFEFDGYNPGVTLELVKGCGNSNGISVSQQTNGFLLEGDSVGIWSFCYRTVSGTQYGASTEIFVSVSDQSVSASCAPIGCSISCYEDFENFPVGSNAYYPNFMPPIVTPPYLTVAMGPNTVDIYEQSENDNNYLSFRYTIGVGGPREVVVIPLTEPILPGCSAIYSFDAVAQPFQGTAYNGIPTLGIYGLSGGFCTNGFPLMDCTVGQTSFCSNVEASCMTLNNPGTVLSGVPIVVDGQTTTMGSNQVQGLNFNTYGPFTFTNTSQQSITHIMIQGRFDVEPTNSNTTIFNIDNFHVEKNCNETLIYGVEIIEKCANEEALVELRICRESDNIGVLPFEVQASVSAGSIITGGGFDPSGVALVPLAPGECIIRQLGINTAGLAPGTPITVTLSASSTVPCLNITEVNNQFDVLLENCNATAFVCPCTASNSINIDATASSPYYNSTLGGVLYSVLEQANNYDANNDGEIYGAEHGGCIAIAGRLIIDQDINFNSANIVMQPCAEILVKRVGSGAFPTLRLETNQINGCEQMWRGITVEDGARLELLENGIADAEFAVTAKASFAGASNLTSVAIQDNLFRRNHVGVIFEGTANQLSTVVHFPFVNNTFLGFEPNSSLLPPCTPGLVNYTPNYGYAGVVTLHTGLFLGASLPSGQISNEFNGLRNGVISKRARLDVRGNRFKNINLELWGTINLNEFNPGGVAAPTYEYSAGIAVAVEQGSATILGNDFDQCMHGVFTAFANADIRDNEFNPVGIAVEAYAPLSLNIRNNINMVFGRRAFVARELNASGRYVIADNAGTNGAVLGLTDNFNWFFPAIHAANVGGIYLENARISGNEITVNNAGRYGFRLEGNGGWVIDRNFVYGTNQLLREGFNLLQSDFNYLSDNFVDRDILQNNRGTAFKLSNSIGNRLCCNTANKTHKAFEFEINCDGTELFTNNMVQQNQSIFCQSGIIGTQFDRGNDFGTLPETATHLGTFNEIFFSRFRVLLLNKPYAPAAVAFAPGTPLGTPWFIGQGLHATCDTLAICKEPGKLPDLQEDIDDTDRAFANGDFGADNPVLQWEGERSLYAKLERKADLRDDDTQVMAFYDNEKNGKQGAYYEAQKALFAQRQLEAVHKDSLAAITTVLDSLDAQLNVKLTILQTAHGQDSLNLLEAVRQNVAAQAWYTHTLTQLQNNIEQARMQKVQAAVLLNSTLPADEIYEQNRKTINGIYLQTLAQNVLMLTPAQFAAVSSIAHQCVFEGGSAVLDARMLYQLHEIKTFDDDTLCSDSRQQRKVILQHKGPQVLLQPNPASDLVQIKGVPESEWVGIRIQLSSVHGQTRIVRPTQAWFSVADLPASVYYCTIWKGDLLLSTQRLMVIH